MVSLVWDAVYWDMDKIDIDINPPKGVDIHLYDSTHTSETDWP